MPQYVICSATVLFGPNLPLLHLQYPIDFRVPSFSFHRQTLSPVSTREPNDRDPKSYIVSLAFTSHACSKRLMMPQVVELIEDRPGVLNDVSFSPILTVLPH